MIYSNIEENLTSIDDLRKGDIWIVLTPIMRVKHYLLYIGDCLVIHNKVNHNWSISDDGVYLENVCDVDKDYDRRGFGKRYLVRRYLGTDEQFNEILRRAWSMLGQKEFSYLFNNCEHFINVVTLGIKVSPQIQDWTLNILNGDK